MSEPNPACLDCGGYGKYEVQDGPDNFYEKPCHCTVDSEPIQD